MDSKTEKNKQQIADYLEYFNRYRRGEEIPQPHPTELGKVIEEAVRLLTNKSEDNERLRKKSI